MNSDVRQDEARDAARDRVEAAVGKILRQSPRERRPGASLTVGEGLFSEEIRTLMDGHP